MAALPDRHTRLACYRPVAILNSGHPLDPDQNNSKADEQPAPRKAGTRQVIATMFWGLCMIGKKGTWERDGVTLTPLQVVAGALVTTLVVIGLLLLLVRMAVG